MVLYVLLGVIYIYVSLSSSFPCKKKQILCLWFLQTTFQVLQLRGIASLLIAPLLTVELSLGISRLFSSNPLTTSLALVFRSLVVITHLVDKVFCPLFTTFHRFQTALVYLVHFLWP